MFTDRIQTYGVSLPPQRPSQRLATPAQCQDLLQEAGFRDLEVCTERLGYYLDDANAYGKIPSAGTAAGVTSSRSTAQQA